MKKLGLALGAGGSRGIAHVGFLQALEEEGIKPDYITGSSMGAVVGGAYAAGIPMETIKNAVLNLRLFDLISPAKQKGGVFGTQKMCALIERYLGNVMIEDLAIPFRSVAVDMIEQEVVEFSQGSLVDAIIASASIPGIFHPLVKEGRRLIDGGVLERVPAMRLQDMGAEVIVAVDVLGWRAASEKVPGAVGILLETFDVMDNYRTKTYREKNKRKINFWLEPDLGNMSQYSLKEAKMAYEKGYALGREYIPKIKRALR